MCSDQDFVAALQKQRERRSDEHQADNARKMVEREQCEFEELQAKIRVQLAEFQRLGKLLVSSESEDRKPLPSNADLDQVKSELTLLCEAVSERSRRAQNAEALIQNLESELARSLPPAARRAWSLLENLDAGLTTMSNSFMNEIKEVRLRFFAWILASAACFRARCDD
jgi:hypothetical protein